MSGKEFGESSLSAADKVDAALAAILHESGLTVALAESCSGGLISKMITDIPGSSAYFLLGAVTYANSAKTRVLGVGEELLIRYGAVSREVAQAMACGVRDLSGSDLGLATTGIAGPEGGSRDKPVGTVYIAIADEEGCSVHCYRFDGGREQVREMTAATALELLYSSLVKKVRDKSR